MNLPQAFLDRMRERLGNDFPAFLASYENPPYKGLRVNTLKISREGFLKISPFALEPIPWEENGFYITEEKPGGDPYHFAGLYYSQEPSAMISATLAGEVKGKRVLDLCAAPGGKTTQLAAAMAGEGILIANEIDYDRAKILSQNVERLGITNCAVTKARPATLAEHFPDYFDVVLVDAPCSGEGMFKKEPNAIPEWSEENVKRCAVRQREILDCAARMLSGGGKLIYSTCTFAEEEDEWQVKSFLERHSEFELLETKKLLPHEIRGEGHFAAVLYKKEGERREFPIGLSTPRGRFHHADIDRALKAYREFADDFFETNPIGKILVRGSRLELVPNDMPDLDPIALVQLRLGVELGEWDGKLFKPAHALAMAYGKNARRKVTLTREESIQYLRGETLETELENGWCVVCVENYPLGLGKVVNGTVKNHLPKGLRRIANDNR